MDSSSSSVKTKYDPTLGMHKRITVTIKDLTVRVHGLGQDYGETVASVVDLRRLRSLFHKNTSERVCYAE